VKKLALIGALLLGLGVSACDLDDGFAIACTAVSTADAGFQIYASTGKVSLSTIKTERKAVAAAQAVCSGPRPQNVQEALAAVNRALAAIATATRKARSEAQRRRV
jgi:hypothetical protein